MLLTTFQLIVAFIIIIVPTIFLITYYFEKKSKRKENFSNMGCLLMVVIPVLPLLFIIYFCPNVYIIEGCGGYKKKVLVFPIKSNGINLTYGKNCYVINNSNNKIETKRAFYAAEKENSKVYNEILIINEHQTKIADVESYDYFFEDFPLSISQGKFASSTKDGIFCHTKG